MFFKKKPALPRLCLYEEGKLIYEGFLKDLPIREEIIIQKSIQFFDDPEPCHIHRNAVSLRLIEEIQKELSATGIPHTLISEYSVFPEADSYTLILSENEKIQGKTDK